MKRKAFIVIILILTIVTVQGKAQTIWGVSNSRTETRDDAGLTGGNGALSGFFQASLPVNYPTGASNWWHLLDVRHSSTANNFAMQFSGSFFDQSLYFRKTNNSPSQLWSRILLETNGKVGIGTIHPSDSVALDIDTKTDWNSAGYLRLIGAMSQPTIYNLTIKKVQIGEGNSSHPTFNYNFDHYQFGTGGFNGTQLSLKWDGTVGIGGGLTIQDAGGYLIGGSIRPGINGLETIGGNKHIITAGQEVRINAPLLLAKRIKVSVKTEDWSDYVFASGYNLRSLTSVERFINQYKHLPNIPSAKVIEKKGLDLAANQALLLKKIEELTLYLIQQDKVNKKQQKLITSQQEMLESFRKEIEIKEKSK